MKAAPAARDVLAGRRRAQRHERAPGTQGAGRRRPRPSCASAGKAWCAHRTGLDRRFYELCVLSELKNALRSGDIWVQGSRQFKDFEEYLLPTPRFAAQREQQELGLAVDTDCERFLEARLGVLERELVTVERLAAAERIAGRRHHRTPALKITPLDNAVPEEADALMRQAYALLPHLKITELLLEVESWTGFTRHFTHLKSGAAAEDQAACC